MNIIGSVTSLIELVRHFPGNYAEWWLNLYHEAPHHVWIETSLFIFIIWLLLIRKTVDPSKSKAGSIRLSKAEEEYLIDSWTPEPLVPLGFTSDNTKKAPVNDLITRIRTPRNHLMRCAVYRLFSVSRAVI